MKAGGSQLLIDVASYKISSSAIALFSRGIICNWLACLAIWMAARADSYLAKAIVIFWVLFAFVASGYEHSVANMTLFSMAMIVDQVNTLTEAGNFRNLTWVTLGNIAGGTVFMGFAYHLATSAAACSQTQPLINSETIHQKQRGT